MSADVGQSQQTEESEQSLFHQTPGEPYDYLRELRDTCPVSWDPLLRGYLITKYADVHEVMSDAERFRLQARPEEQYSEHFPMARVNTFRKMLREANLEPYVETIIKPEIDRLFGAFESTGRAELFEQFANPFSANIISRLFGIPEADFEDLIAYRDARSAVFNSPPDAAADAAKVAAEWQAKVDVRMHEVIAEHRAHPQNDLTTYLLESTEDGQPLSEEDIIQISVRDLLVAGSETATRAICNSTYRMLTIPGMYERLLADRSLVHGFVEEALRFDPPVQVFWRAANGDEELSGCPVDKDSQLFPSIAGANRDPEKFDRPDEFDLTRKIGRHITFSAGPHRCPGAWLGREETELAIESILDRLPNLRLDPDVAPPELQEVVLRNWSPLNVRFGQA